MEGGESEAVPPDGVNFVRNIKEVAILCIENGKEKLFANLMASVPTKNGSDDNLKKTTWSCRKCKKTYKTKNGYEKHRDACKKDKYTHKDKSVGGADNARESQKKSGNKYKENVTNTKNDAKKDPKSRRKQCIFCKEQRILIENHYLTKHKLDYHKIINVSEKDLRNSTTCPQCNEDYYNEGAFKKHLFDYHNINCQPKTARQRLKKKNAQKQQVNENATAPPEVESTRNNLPAQVEGEPIQNYPAAQEEREMETETEGETIENPNIEHDRERVIVHTNFCVQCNQYVNVSSLESHTALHQKERDDYPFKTTRNSKQSATIRQKADSSHSNGTVKNPPTCQQGSHVLSNHAPVNQTKTTDNLNKGAQTTQVSQEHAAGNKSQEETYSGLDNGQESQDIREEIDKPQNKLADANNEQRELAEISDIDVDRRHYRKTLWIDYFERMKLENQETQSELFAQFLEVYTQVAPKAAVCYKRLTRRQPSVDAGSRQRRVDVMSMTVETSTRCQSGVSFTKKITYLKTVKYE